MEWTYHALNGSSALFARDEFIAFLKASCHPESDFGSAELVFVELVANAIRHAPGPIGIRVHLDGQQDCVALRVTDAGPGFSFAPALPADLSETGRGLYIVSKLCATLSTERTPDGNTVVASLPVAPRRVER